MINSKVQRNDSMKKQQRKRKHSVHSVSARREAPLPPVVDSHVARETWSSPIRGKKQRFGALSLRFYFGRHPEEKN